MLIAISPPSASISRTIFPLASPPIAGLQLILEIVSKFPVTSIVRAPFLDAANAASQPACPAPQMMTSKPEKLFISYTSRWKCVSECQLFCRFVSNVKKLDKNESGVSTLIIAVGPAMDVVVGV